MKNSFFLRVIYERFIFQRLILGNLYEEETSHRGYSVASLEDKTYVEDVFKISDL